MHWIGGLGVRLAVLARPRAGDWLEDEIKRWKGSGLDRMVCLLEPSEIAELGLESEQRICESVGIAFTSFPIPDRGVPEKEALEKLIRTLSGELLSGVCVGVHCRAGIGRTGLVAGCLLKALGVSSDEAVGLVSLARGVRVPDTEEQLGAIRRFEFASNRR